jgi:uncharacterized oxidoreductase
LSRVHRRDAGFTHSRREEDRAFLAGRESRPPRSPISWQEAARRIDDKLLVDTVTTNLMGPIRMSSALIEHLKQRDDAVIAYTSSILGFVPLAFTAVYSATKAALHSYVLSQRFLLKGTGVRVLEMAPPWVTARVRVSRSGCN